MIGRLRILSHNILEGFSGLDGSIDAARLAAAKSLAAKLDPDVLVLNEAVHCASEGPLRRDYAAWFGFEHSACVSYDGDWGNIVLSKHPLEPVREYAIHNRSGLAVRVRVGEDSLVIATYHPHPSRLPENKAEDFRRLVEGLDEPCVLCGDFNAINPEDGTDLDRLSEAFRSFTPAGRERWAAERFVEGGKAVFAALEQAGFRDALDPSMRGPTIPTRLLSDSDDSAMRIDHIAANGRVRVLAGGVVSGPEADAASDHYPIWADVSLERRDARRRSIPCRVAEARISERRKGERRSAA